MDSFGGYKGIILSGSPALSAQDEQGGWSRAVLDLGIPVLGFCFGHQEIAKHGGGEVEHTRREYGAATLHRVADSPLFAGLESQELVWMSHGDTVTSLGEGFVERPRREGARLASLTGIPRVDRGPEFREVSLNAGTDRCQL